MRSVSWVLVVVACGGSAPPPAQPAQAPIANTAPAAPAPAPPPAMLPGLDPAVCEQRAEAFGPVPLTPAQVGQRRGTGVTRLAEAPTSKSAPIEVCMPDGQRGWLQAAQCADGSPPRDAQRGGSVGPGGACGSVIDVYNVTCPEQTYEVYMDMYMCPADGS